MKLRFFFFALIFAAFAGSACVASVPDSISKKVALLAARGDVSALRPIYAKVSDELPTYTRLYCDMALARADENHGRMGECIDSLLKFYPKRLGIRGMIALSELRAEALRREGKYAELESYCKKQIKYYKRRNVMERRLEMLRQYQNKGGRLKDGSYRSRLLSLADRNRPFQLFAEFGKATSKIDGYARYRCLLALGCFNKPQQTGQAADSLLAHYGDSLDSDGLTLCLRTKAEMLISRGQWHKLKLFCESNDSTDDAHAALISYYKSIATKLDGKPSFDLVRPAKVCSVPISRNWPIYVDASVNGSDKMPFLLDTGQGKTIITRDDAKRCNAEILPDTLHLTSSIGMLTVNPVFVNVLKIGEIEMRNFLVYVPTQESDLPEVYSRVLGNEDLSRLGIVDIYMERMFFSPADAGQCEQKPNIRFAADGSLRIMATHDDSAKVFCLDTGCPSNVFSSIVFPRATTDTIDFKLGLADTSAGVPELTLSEGKATDHSGLIGTPFFRSFEHVRLDYANMMATFDTPTEFSRHGVYDYIENGDIFGLERNKTSLEDISSDKYKAFMRLYISSAKNNPDETLRLADEAMRFVNRKKGEGDFLFVQDIKLNSLIAKGEYAEASAFLKKANEEDLYSGESRDMLVEMEKIYSALSNEKAPMLVSRAERSEIPFVPSDGGFKVASVNINKRRVEVIPNISDDNSYMSAWLAKKLKARIVYTDTESGRSEAVVDSISVGGFVLKNFVFVVKPGKDKNPVLGFDLFRLLPCVELSAKSVIIETKPAENRTWFPLRNMGSLCVEALAGKAFATMGIYSQNRSSITAKAGLMPVELGRLSFGREDFVPAGVSDDDNWLDGFFSVEELVKKNGSIVFDFKNMRLGL